LQAKKLICNRIISIVLLNFNFLEWVYIMAKKITGQLPLILAVETSGRVGSVALAQGPLIIDITRFSAPMRHSAELFVAIGQLLGRMALAPKDIGHIYISHGPGSFTGIRIAVTMAKTMNFANNVKIVAVNTLDAIAANATDYIGADSRPDQSISNIASILDAKREQFFIATYQNKNGHWAKTTEDCLMEAPEFVRRFGGKEPVWLLGEGLVYYAHLFAGQGINFIDKEYWPAKAEKVHQLGWQMACENKFADPLKLTPHYLRGPDAVPKKSL
jgi:tRNA threonylcarbamoyladenosine biosynthesis protein TsaB